MPLSRPILSLRRVRRAATLALCFGVAGIASAQGGFAADDPDWKESEAPPPPAFDQKRLVPIEMPLYMSLQFGIDPATISISGDGVVRYVVVATNKSGGGMNAFYDAMRCATNETKTYARYSENAWQVLPASEWKKLIELRSSYTRAIALQGICRGRAPRASVAEMIDRIKNPVRSLD